MSRRRRVPCAALAVQRKMPRWSRVVGVTSCWTMNMVISHKKLLCPVAAFMVPYQLRHSGPSWDRCQTFRQLDAIQKRGGWRSL